ncbi:hypothetical protein [Micromonospora auratinigra]|uniref:Peptidase inhibitor family I36 n=1 Tax=Micromonospora auratinigra TaxID=261654 RepID=A0A1A8Z0E8_9ACTN|nr:hypothetical protein [Micromonospora auratinigra]SBT37307.1 hypothetical protein GA0070611_0158 [Micromonospora auratinigra]
MWIMHSTLEDCVRRFARRLSTSLLAATVAVVTFAAPARAANPYTPAQACGNEFGGSWTASSDGHRSIVADNGVKLGDVYLMYNYATDYNCVTMIKARDIGTASPIKASIKVDVEGTLREWQSDSGSYKYYAAVQRYANNMCVQYYGSALYGGYWQGNGRTTWGNCI